MRIVTASSVLILLPTIIYYRVKSNTGEEIPRYQAEGLFMSLATRLVSTGTVLALIIHLYRPFLYIDFPMWARRAGALELFVGAALIVWTLWHLGKNLSDCIAPRQRHFLVMTGPYRYLRHPYYYGTVAWLTGSGVAVGSSVVLAGALTLMLLFDIRARREEDMLHDRYDNIYRGYWRKTWL